MSENTKDDVSLDTSQLSDEEMLNSSFEPPAAKETEVAEVVEEAVEQAEEPTTESVEETVTEGVEEKPVLDDDAFAEAKSPAELVPEKEVVAEPETKTEVPTETAETKTVNYEDFYKQIMTPFKANGKMIELKDPQEAVQLMQMGANYTRKMQDLQVVKKQITMLENNGLLDEGKLSFLIDLDKKNPEAIKKFLKEAEIDPLDIDVSEESKYQAGNHIVSDDEVKFRTVLDAVSATPEGKAALQVIHTSWDQASKDALWASPDIMETIAEQKTNGIYDRVAAEVERQSTLGGIKPGTPFLTAYREVGHLMGNQGAFNDILQKQNSSQQYVAPKPVAPIATKVAAPKTVVKNNLQVAAAAPTRTVNKRAVTVANLATLNDDQFMQQFAGRL